MTKQQHQILIGPYRSGKSWRLLEQVVDHCLNKHVDDAGNKNIAASLKNKTVVLVPSNRYRQLVENRLAKIIAKRAGAGTKHSADGDNYNTASAKAQSENAQNENAPSNNNEQNISGLLGLEILTIHQFCQASLFDAGLFIKLLPNSAKLPLLNNICQKLIATGQVKQLAPILHFSGTQQSILSLIDEWQRADYRAVDIVRKTKEAADQNKELGQIYLAYEQALDKINCCDSHTLIFKLSDLLKDNKQLNGLSDYIVFDGFDRFNAMQLELCSALAQHVKQIYVGFDYEKPQDTLFEEYAWKERSYEQINNHLGKLFEREISATPPSNNFNNGNSACQIDCFSSGDRLAEMGIIAARIKAAIISGAAKPNEIVLTARSLTPYKAAIEAAFKDANLEYYIDEPISLQNLSLTRFLLMLLSLADNDFMRTEVIECLRSPYLRLAAIGLNKKDIETVNALSLDRKVVSGERQWQKALSGDAKLNKAVSQFCQELKMPSSILTAIDYVSWVEDLIDKFVDLANFEEESNSPASWTQKEALAQFRKQLASLIQEETILDLLSEPNRNTRQPKVLSSVNNAYYEQLKSLVEAANFTGNGQNINQVLVTSAELVPNQQYKQIYLAGMIEGEFPAVKNTNGFLSAREIEQWRKQGVYIYNPRTEAGFEYALFASLINRAQEKITLSYPTIESTSSKDELLPSFFFNALKIEADSIEFIAFENSVNVFSSPRNALAYLLWQEHDAETIAAKYSMPGLHNYLEPLQEKFTFAAMRSKQLNNSALNGYLVDHVAASTIKVDLPEYWNAGQLSDYGKCPFAYWLNRTLKIAPPEEPAAGLNARDRGTFYHRALEIFYKKIIEKKIKISVAQQAQVKELFEQSVQEGLKWLEQEQWFRAGEFWNQEKNTLIFRMNNFFTAEYNRFIAEGGQFEPYLAEAVFGPNAEYAPLSLTKNGKTIKLRGKIDRIDISSSGFGENKKLRIIDYKSGATPINQEDVASGRNLQLPLYALAAQKSILPQSKVSNYNYLAISTGKLLAAKRDDEIEIDNDFKMLEERVFEFIASIEKGDFSVRPSDTKVCVNCEHQTVCRVKEFPARHSDRIYGQSYEGIPNSS